MHKHTLKILKNSKLQEQLLTERDLINTNDLVSLHIYHTWHYMVSRHGTYWVFLSKSRECIDFLFHPTYEAIAPVVAHRTYLSGMFWYSNDVHVQDYLWAWFIRLSIPEYYTIIIMYNSNVHLSPSIYTFNAFLPLYILSLYRSQLLSYIIID